MFAWEWPACGSWPACPSSCPCSTLAQRGRIVALDPHHVRAPVHQVGVAGFTLHAVAADRRGIAFDAQVQIGRDGQGGCRGGRGRFGRIVRRARRRRQAGQQQAGEAAPDGCVQGFLAGRLADLAEHLVLSMVPLKIFAPAPPANSMTSPPPWVSAPGLQDDANFLKEVVVKVLTLLRSSRARAARSRPCCRLPGWSCCPRRRSGDRRCRTPAWCRACRRRPARACHPHRT